MKSVVIVAAGKSERFGKGGINKVDIILKNKPIYMYSVDVFLDLGFEVVLVHNGNLKINNVKVVKGGKTRSESVYNGVLSTTKDIVYIHDAARPLINEKLIKMLDIGLEENAGIYLAKTVNDSLKKCNLEQPVAVDRSKYLTAETPQVFKRDLLLEAFNKRSEDYLDEASMVQEEIINSKVLPVFHNESNDKITTLSDLERIKKLLGVHYRIGHSFDIHRLVENRKLILGGIEIPYHLGLLGHSDADVLIHVVTEAILGALGADDLGTNFPDNDPKYQDISSVVLLKSVLNQMKTQKYGISNIDISLYLEEPKIKIYREKILNNLEFLLAVEKDKINLKATTTEKIGPIGKNEAIACEAVVLLVEV